MHALTERRCFGLVVEAAGPTVKPPRESLDIPRFDLPTGSPTDMDDLTDGRIPDTLPQERVLHEIVNIPRNQSDLRARWTGGAITVHVDDQRMESIPHGFRIALRNRHASFTGNVALWGNCEGQAVLLANHSFSLIDSDPDELTQTIRLINGSEVRIQAVARGTDDAPVLTFRIAYDVEFDATNPNTEGVARFVLVIPFTPKTSGKDVRPKSRDPSTTRT
jgi:hypothetical protein